MTTYTIVDVKNTLYVRMDEPDYHRPVMVSIFWPTTLRADFYPALINQTATGYTDGRYDVYLGNGDHKIIQLPQGGQTHNDPTLTVETPIKPPSRGGKSWRWVWDSGRWKKRYI